VKNPMTRRAEVLTSSYATPAKTKEDFERLRQTLVEPVTK